MKAKKLELKDVASGVQYGLKCQNQFGISDIIGIRKRCSSNHNIMVSYELNGEIIWGYDYQNKPIYRPITDLTKEITHKGETFVPLIEMAKMAFPNHSNFNVCIFGSFVTFEGYDGAYFVFYFDNGSFNCEDVKERALIHIYNVHMLFDKLDELFIDYRGLISAGLAIDVNTLETDPYK